MKFTLSLLANFSDFLHNAWGCVQKPYSTYRSLEKKNPNQLIIIFLFIGLYFFLVAPIKIHSLHPFFVTLKASKLFTWGLLNYILIVLLLYLLGKIYRSQSRLDSIMLTWGYSLLPTLIWFLATSIFYVILPPPRQQTVLGNLFSIFYLTFSTALLFWKAVLYYLTLRFGLKFSLGKIIQVSIIFLPLLTIYSYWLYKIGIFKIPFI